MSLFSNFKQPTYLGYLAIPRILVGYHFLQVGWPKLSARFLSGEGLARQLTENLAKDPVSWHRDFIAGIVVPHSQFFSYLVAFGEVAIAVSLIAGCLVRVSSLCGAFHNLNIYLAIAIPSGNGLQIVVNRLYIALHLIFVCASAGRALGIDGILKRKFPKSRLF